MEGNVIGENPENGSGNLIIDSKGTTVTVPTQEAGNGNTPISSQNEINPWKYDTEVKTIPTITVQDPGGNKYFPQDAHFYNEDLEDRGHWEAKEGAKVAPDSVELIVAKEKQDSPVQEDGSDKPNDTPPKKQTYWEKDAERYEKFQDTGESQRTRSKRIDDRSKWTKRYNESVQKDAVHQEALKTNEDANKGVPANNSLSESTKSFFQREDQIAQDAKRREAAHQEALRTNEEANKGVPANNSLSESTKSFFQREDQIAQDAKRDAAHQEALRTNEEANRGIPDNNPLSEGAKSFFQSEDQIAQDAKRDAAHQEALRTNEEANRGIPDNNPLSEGAKSFFQREDQIAQDARRAADNSGEEELTPEQLLEQRMARLEEQLNEIRQALEELRNSNRVQEGEDITPLPQEDGEDTPPILQEDGGRILTSAEEEEAEFQRRLAEIEAQRATERRDRRRQTAAVIVGALTGFGTATVVATTALPAIVGIAAGATVISRAGLWMGERKQRQWSNQLEYITDPSERAKIIRKLETVRKINYGLRTLVVPFGGGFIAGLVAGSFFKAGVMGGESLMDKFASGGSGTTEIGTGGTGLDNIGGHDVTNVDRANPLQDIPQGTETISTPEIPSQDVLVSNGKVNLPGSPWDGNAASNIANAGEVSHSMFPGGIYDQAASLTEKALQSSGLTRTAVLENLGTDGTHQLLNGFLQSVQAGNTNPSLANVLGSMNNPGAQNLLSMIK